MHVTNTVSTLLTKLTFEIAVEDRSMERSMLSKCGQMPSAFHPIYHVLGLAP